MTTILPARSYDRYMKIIKLADNPQQNETYTVLVNPGSYQEEHSNCFSARQPIGAQKPQHTFNRVKPSSLRSELLFDSTGSLGITAFSLKEGVMQQVETFLRLVHETDEEAKEPPHLQLIWGPLFFEGIASNISISYTHFDRFGSPIRATATCTFKESSKTVSTESGTTEAGLSDAAGATPPAKNPFTLENDQKHLANQLIKYGGYLKVLQKQPYENLPNSLRNVGIAAAIDQASTN